jgi:hypothetical protein
MSDLNRQNLTDKAANYMKVLFFFTPGPSFFFSPFVDVPTPLQLVRLEKDDFGDS